MSQEYRDAPPDNRTATGKRIPGQKREENMASEPMDFAEFYASAKDDCLRAVLAAVGDPPTAEDLVAEAFARAWAAWRKVSEHPSPQAWVVRTALNTRVSWWRRRRREVAVGQAEGLAAEPGGDGHEPADTQLMAAVARLPLRQRQVVGLRLFLDLDTARTAEVLGIAPGTVTAHMARAIATLREEFTSAREQETS
jgi:RNA polymerase sigma-70 factor (sigma-E family)